MSVTGGPSATDPRTKSVISFASGAAFGATSVVTAQPFDTIKSRMQTLSSSSPNLNSSPGSGGTRRPSALAVATDLYRREGVRGLYRGGASMLVGGALFRSAQFGCYDVALHALGGPVPRHERVFFGALDPHVVAAGFVGGLGRGVVESPFEYAKVRRQVETPWRLRDVYRGSGITITRNSFLFACFAINIDLLKHVVGPVSPFWVGAICANAAWFTIWPLDVVKSRRQSGLYEGVPVRVLLRDVARSGALYRGLLPGLLRSTVANGTGMYMYDVVQRGLTKRVAGG